MLVFRARSAELFFAGVPNLSRLDMRYMSLEEVSGSSRGAWCCVGFASFRREGQLEAH